MIVFVLCASDSLLHVAAGELGSLLVHSQVQSGRQRASSRLVEEADADDPRGESVKTQAIVKDEKTEPTLPALYVLLTPLLFIMWFSSMISHRFKALLSS